MSMHKLWNDHCRSLDKLRKTIEAMSERLPGGTPGKRIRDSLSRSWEMLSESIDRLDEAFIDSVQPLPVDFPWRDKEFVAHWTLYKEYMNEQHGVVIKSRMEQSRLRLIKRYSNDDRQTFIRTIDYYMAIGAEGVFAVNFEPEKKHTDNESKQTVTLKLGR